MMVCFDFLSKPIDLEMNKVSVLCIENPRLYRETVGAFYDNCPEESNIVFSENFSPVKFSNRVLFVPDVFSLSFSSSFMKKIYDGVSAYSNTYLQEEMLRLRSEAAGFLEKVAESFDFDFEYNENLDISDFLKMQGFHPSLCKDDLLSTLLDFLTLTKKYSTVKCFVLLNLHLLFGQDELDLLYKELEYREINLLVLENVKAFSVSDKERVFVVDNDLCEIIDS